jgi:phosphoribosylanthranilate isomerase
MSVFVKICGIANRDDALAVAALKPDAMGFVFWQKSKRYAKPSVVGQWTAALPASILKVGVFVDAPPREVRNAVLAAGLDVAQLHGSENLPDYAGLGFKVWRVVRPGKDAAALADAWPVDALLVDTYSPEAPGGTGQVGDWDAARAFVAASRHRVLLAGGLKPDNVAEAIRAVQPWGVDVSSGVEERPGKKDLDKVREFIEKCRQG